MTNAMVADEFRIHMTAHRVRPGSGVDEFPVTLEEIESHTAVVGSLLEVQAVSTVMSALVNARGRGISEGTAIRGLVTAKAMTFAADAVRDAIGNFYDDPAGYCDLAVVERPDVAKVVKDTFMELMGLATQFDVNFQACVDSRTEFERNRVAELAGLTGAAR